jgi:hypothetical protein
MILKKLRVGSATEEIPRILWNLKGHYHADKSPSLVLTVSQLYPVNNLQIYFCKILLNITVCSLKSVIVRPEETSVLGYGTINSDATVEHERPRQRSNSYARNIRGIVESGVLSGSVQRLYLENRNAAESVESPVDFEFGGRQSETVRAYDIGPWRRSGRRRSPCCKPLHRNVELVVTRQPARSWKSPSFEDMSSGAEERPLLEDVTQQCSETVTQNSNLCDSNREL